jgi:hypothetical protein
MNLAVSRKIPTLNLTGTRGHGPDAIENKRLKALSQINKNLTRNESDFDIMLSDDTLETVQNDAFIVQSSNRDNLLDEAILFSTGR